MPLKARRHIRKMRGGAQAHLIQADDGRFWVVKFQNNPQHRRVLLNEMIAAAFLDYLQISHPAAAIIDVSREFLRDNAEVAIQFGSRRVEVKPGWQFGSLYPGDPDTVAVYDFIPDAMLAQVANIAEFPGILAFDKWMGNCDGRQSVFFRARLTPPRPAQEDASRTGFVAMMIDHGYVFNGPHWEFADAPAQGLYHRPVVYDGVRSIGAFEPWLDRIARFPEDVVDEACRRLPLEWLEADEGELERLLEALLRRRSRVSDLLCQCRSVRPGWFPNWH